jgi:hypothetical protein
MGAIEQQMKKCVPYLMTNLIDLSHNEKMNLLS